MPSATNLVRIAAGSAIIWIAGTFSMLAQEAGQLEQMLSKEEQSQLELSKMTPDKRAALRQTLIRVYQQGVAQAKAKASFGTSAGAIETQIQDEFNGWEGETVVKLLNGQIWQQTEYHYEYKYAFMPKVLIYSAGGGYKMKVDGTSKAVTVERLR